MYDKPHKDSNFKIPCIPNQIYRNWCEILVLEDLYYNG